MNDLPITITFTGSRADYAADVVRLRDIAAQAENFRKELDDLRDHFATMTTDRHRSITAFVDQAAAAAQDLASAADLAAEAIN